MTRILPISGARVALAAFVSCGMCAEVAIADSMS